MENPPSTGSEDDIDVRHAIFGLLSHWKLMLLLSVLGAAAAGLLGTLHASLLPISPGPRVTLFRMLAFGAATGFALAVLWALAWDWWRSEREHASGETSGEKPHQH